MHVVSRYTAAEAAATIDPRGRAIALSVVIAAGALLLIMPPVIGVTGTLSLLTALIAAFGVGWGFTRGQSWLYRSPLAATRWAFLLSAAGWLLALVAWYGGQDWPALLPGVACGGAGAAVAWRIAAGRTALPGMRVSGATVLSVAIAIAATLLTWHTAGGGRHGVCFAFAVLLDWALLGALDLRLRKDMQNELKNIQQRMGITFIYVTHDQEEALTMSDTIVVMDKGKIQQIGTPEDIYNEPKNAFVADFIGESNILDGVMLEDYQVKFFGRKFQCVDKGFAPNEPVDVVIRPEDIDIVPPEQGHLTGTVTSVTFKGVHYDTIVDFKGFKWLIQTTDYCPVDSFIGIRLNPEDIHIMHKSEYSGLYGDYSSYSAEYDEIADASEEEADEE